MINKSKFIVRTGYNQCAQQYLSNRDLFENQKYLDSLIKLLPPGAQILDLGCGSGIPIDKYLFDKGFAITGIDISEEQIKLARQNLPQANYSTKDMSEIDYSANSFDAVISFYAIFHLPREEHLDLLKKVFPLIKPGGFLLITMGASDWEGTEDDFHGAKMFWSHFGSKKNIELVQQAGFSIIYNAIDTSGNEKHLIVFAQKIRL